MYKELKDRVALVTGSSRGFGRGIAERLAAEGVHVVINYRRSRSDAEETAEAIEREYGVEALVARADVGRENHIDELFETIDNHFGRLDILVSNAAFGRVGPLMETPSRHFDVTMNSCAKALMLLAQQAVPMMEERGGGRIISMTSIGGQRVIPGYGAVGPAKAALESLTRALAVELGPKGILVNGVLAGVADTSSMRALPQAQELLDDYIKTSPLGRAVKPGDVADVVAFLCSNGARMVNGHLLVVDGGQSIIAT